MAVSDPQGLLGMQFPGNTEKYDELARFLFIQGKPDLKGSAPIRLLDAALSRAFGMLFSAGRSAPSQDDEYLRLAANFKRIGKMALAMRFLGPIDRLFVRLGMRTAADISVRQEYRGVKKGSDFLEAARGYFAVTDLFGFKIEVLDVTSDEVKFKFLECPIGYVAGDDIRICMATNKWDRHCAQLLGGRLLMEELIPEGAPGCIGHIVAADRKLPEEWRRYARRRI